MKSVATTMSRLQQEIVRVPDGHGHTVPVCLDCFNGRHDHLEFLEDRERLIAVLKEESAPTNHRYFLRRVLDYKNVDPENTVQCCCRVGVP